MLDGPNRPTTNSVGFSPLKRREAGEADRVAATAQSLTGFNTLLRD